MSNVPFIQSGADIAAGKHPLVVFVITKFHRKCARALTIWKDLTNRANKMFSTIQDRNINVILRDCNAHTRTGINNCITT